ncbi:hypothetical protein A3H38_04180 [candidate division WOR-1 bacterium RIFCSPLOWO2_02_FULL_46_20]|uniref:Arginase n=2 Tax=Saganbacteria TaxID=1703751 RepID=A0A1F4RD00_UNCSA|nr:MAG: hypothetical protein A3J44_03050 [candidate division WOR-1 bacterium RIFCSPHIGHO2_02_FULL_45_12]OGC06050.1 MAG: hypothetical protein A3H38_04180 [candidate division WOR-1 bacterium RIFCSPLOWO2_02_FULL_46_20]OGC09241.1 MAG: hypothetical protein A3F86_00910 [candidate division WOR-1 bacterium RIFCSPLOWO2_12_FULL_45_9]
MRITQHGQFNPYAGSKQFSEIYQHDPSRGRLINRFSDRGAGYTPLVVGGIEDLDPAVLMRRDQNLLLDIAGVPAYLFEHHSGTAYAAAEAIEFDVMAKGATLFHFDAHPDMESCGKPLDDSLEALFRFFSSAYNEESFIWEMVRRGDVAHIVWFTSSPGPMFINGNERDLIKAFPHITVTKVSEQQVAGFDRTIFTSLPRNQRILDIDYDYFAHLKNQHAFSIVDLLQFMFRNTGLVTQALSPEYIEIRLAAILAAELMTSVHRIVSLVNKI